MRSCLRIAQIRLCAMRSCMDWSRTDFDWNQARAFLAAAREGSYSAAARALGTTQPTIGRQVSALEASLGVALFERVGRGLALTDAGMELAEHVGAMGDAAMRVSLAAAGQSTALDGLVRITASEVITAHLLPPVVERVRREHPGIELELVASNAVQDLRRREADIAVRNARPKDPELVGRKVRDAAGRMYASRRYVERVGPLEAPEDIARAEVFGFDHTDVMLDWLRALGLPVTRSSFPVVTANHLVQWELARRGHGICVMMEDVGDADPEMCRVFPSLPAMPVPIWVVSHRELHTSRRMRVVFDLLGEVLAEPPGDA